MMASMASTNSDPISANAYPTREELAAEILYEALVNGASEANLGATLRGMSALLPAVQDGPDDAFASAFGEWFVVAYGRAAVDLAIWLRFVDFDSSSDGLTYRGRVRFYNPELGSIRFSFSALRCQEGFVCSPDEPAFEVADRQFNDLDVALAYIRVRVREVYPWTGFKNRLDN